MNALALENLVEMAAQDRAFREAHRVACAQPGVMEAQQIFRMVEAEAVARDVVASGFAGRNGRAAAHQVMRAAKAQAVANWVAGEAKQRISKLEADLAKLVVDHGVADLPGLFAAARLLTVTAFDEMFYDVDEAMAKVAKASAKQAKAALAEHHGVEVGLPALDSVAGTPVLGATLREHFQKMEHDFTFRFRAAVRQGAQAGESVDTIVERFTGGETLVTAAEDSEGVKRALGLQVRVADASESALDKLMSAAAHVFSQEAEHAALGGAEEGDAEDMGWQWVAVLDERTCERCEFYDGQRWDKDYEPVDKGPAFPEDPPLHPNCRCAVVPSNLTEEPAPEASFDDYLAQFSRAEQEATFGKAALRAYRRGDITAGQLVNQKGHKISPDELGEESEG